MGVLWLLLGAVGGGGIWYAHVRLYPWRNCPRCSGGKRNYSISAHRDCRRCKATGRVRRWGAPSEEN
jgi:hypothetical protein